MATTTTTLKKSHHKHVMRFLIGFSIWYVIYITGNNVKANQVWATRGKSIESSKERQKKKKCFGINFSFLPLSGVSIIIPFVDDAKVGCDCFANYVRWHRKRHFRKKRLMTFDGRSRTIHLFFFLCVCFKNRTQHIWINLLPPLGSMPAGSNSWNGKSHRDLTRVQKSRDFSFGWRWQCTRRYPWNKQKKPKQQSIFLSKKTKQFRNYFELKTIFFPSEKSHSRKRQKHE